ncbi:MAG: pyridoxine 5'-phosphate synthase [Bacteroidales bacterium]|nr:pyridoxine 5'-phosphate synthase [Bacteroidales bacterium]
MTKLSVNINKIATLRNARGGNNPDVLKAAIDCERFGAQGITVHPRPDERHIRYEDVRMIRPVVTTELNIEGYPSDAFIRLVTEVKPHQVTLVPDPPDAITSSEGWDSIRNASFLNDVISVFKAEGIRTSLFIDISEVFIEGAKKAGADRVELYTEPYARKFPENPAIAIKDYVRAAEFAREIGLELNAGHDLDLDNLPYLAKSIPWISEVSIGHALICDALYYGLGNTIQMYLRALEIK